MNRKQPVERGPFGRPTSRRATSRSKTATPGPKDDPANLENLRTIDDILGKLKHEQGENEAKPPRDARPSMTSARLQQSQTAVDAPPTAQNAPKGGQAASFKEPTEILIHGYAAQHVSEALERYEAASEGRMYEDYDRSPPAPRYGALLHQVRATLPRSLPLEARRKINTYSGGDHWIKVTLDSPEAAQKACFFSPMTLHGYLVYAEPWRGVGPNSDVATPANPAIESGAKTFKQRRPIQPGQRDAFASVPGRLQSAYVSDQRYSDDPNDNNGSPDTSETLSSATAVSSGHDAQQTSRNAQSTLQQPQSATLSSGQSQGKPLRISGATRAVLRPYTEAFVPVAPWSQRTFGHIPLLGSLFGGDPNAKPGQGGGIIGSAVPRKDDGSFDWNSASVYWRVCWVMDKWLGTDLCGMKGDD